MRSNADVPSDQDSHVALEKRDDTVDVLRGIAIILVVLGHANRGAIGEGLSNSVVWRYVDYVIYAVHMPVFFYLAGYFSLVSVKRHSRWVFVRSRLPNLVLPYVVWSFLYFLSGIAVGYISKINRQVRFEELLQIYYQPITVLWFLYALLILQVLMICALRATPLMLLLAFASSLLLSNAGELGHIPLISAVSTNAPFFFVGVLIAQRRLPPVYAATRGGVVSLILLLIFVSTALAVFRFQTEGLLRLASVPLAALGMMGLGCLSAHINLRFVQAARLLQSLGKASLAIYLLHVLTLALVPRALKFAEIDSVLSRIFVGTVVGVGGSYAAYRALERLGWARRLGLP